MRFTVEPHLRLTLRQGTVYYMQHRDMTSAKPHYMIVLNHDPLSGHLLLLSCFTSNVNDAKRRLASIPETLVLVCPGEYATLTVDSAIDCNDVFTLDIPELEGKIKNQQARPCADLPTAVIRRILAAVAASKNVSREHQRLIADPVTATRKK